MKYNLLLLLTIFSLITLASAGPYSSAINQGPYSSNINQIDTGNITYNVTNIYNNNTYTGGNSSWNQSLADALYVNINGDTMTGDLEVEGNITADYFIGDGSFLTGISKWIVSTTNGFLYNDTDTFYFNDSLLNDTIDARAASVEKDFNIFINGSSYDNIHHNITAGDADNVEFTIIPGNKFIFADTFT